MNLRKLKKNILFKKNIRSKCQRSNGKSANSYTRHFFISLFFRVEMAGIPLKLNTNQPFDFWLKYQIFGNRIIDDAQN